MSAQDWAEHVRRIDPVAYALFASATREEFLEAVEAALADVAERMERSRVTYRRLDERGLSAFVVEMLGKLVPASAETHSNGHVDVTVRHPRGLSFQHLTECKIWNGDSWHRQGMLQLLGYAGGREVRTMCLAFFVRHRRMVFLLERLRRELEQGGDPPPLGLATDHPTIRGAFVTQHAHESGATLGIVHLGCHLFEVGPDEADGDGDGG